MKAILSLVVLFGSVNVFASAETRFEFQQAYKRQQQERCAKDLKCALETQIKNLVAQRNNAINQLASLAKEARFACENTSVRTAERQSVDGVVKYVDYTPCEKIQQYHENLNSIAQRRAQVNAQIARIDAEIVLRSNQLNALGGQK